jgi:CHAT domain-containing protein
LILFREVDKRAEEGTILNSLGEVYRSLGQSDYAIDLYEQALVIAREIGDRVGEGNALNNLGIAYYNLGQYGRSTEFYEQSLAVSREIGDLAGEGRTLGNLGNVYASLGLYDVAIEFHEKRLEIARDIGDRVGEGIALGNLGITYDDLSEYDLALEQYGQSIALFNELGVRSSKALFLSNIGKLFNDRDQPELAIIFLKASVKVREAIRGDIHGLDTDLQQSFTDTIADDYRLLADLLLQQDRILEAQRVLDLLKVQELDDYLRGVQRNGDTEQGVPLRPDEQAILDLFNGNQDQLIALGRELDELDDIPRGQRSEAQQARIIELRRLQAVQRSSFIALLADEQVQAAVQRLRNTTGGEALELQSFDALRDNLAELEQNAVVLYPFVLDDRLELILVTPYGPPINRTVPVERVALNRVIAEFRAALHSPRRDPRPAAQQLYDWLIRPLEADLAQARAETLIYTPDSQLRYIPLAALHDGEQWLVQQYAVNNITAASLDDLTSQPFSDGFNILAAAVTEDRSVDLLSGDTLFFPGLTFAGQEVSTLAELIPGTDQRLNNDFSTDLRWEFNDYAIIHLATHATFQPGVPEESFILFGDGRADLTEIKNTWSFPNVDLVVLSACETGVGEELGDGSEILGFGYLMQQAGADAAIASLWKVSDPGTQVFMTRFYQALQGGHIEGECIAHCPVSPD